MGFIKEFREFALKGNVVDLAIAVILAGAFGRIVTALTEALIMPVISLILGKGGVSEITFQVGETIFPVGLLLQAIIDFLLIALVLFGIIKGMNKLNREKEEIAAPAEPELTLSEKLLVEIRDSVKANRE
jgi:large conductance mechanosensitive channel